MRTKHIFFPGSNAKMSTIHRKIVGNGIGGVLLDGGIGGQSSYHGLEDYMSTVNHGGRNRRLNEGRGLSDKISSQLRNLNISPPSKTKIKNITLSI